MGRQASVLKLSDFRKFIGAQEWTASKHVAAHEYIVRARVKNDVLFNEFVLKIRKSGFNAKFKGTTYRYYELDGYKYWTMGAPLHETIIINRAKSDKDKAQTVLGASE